MNELFTAIMTHFGLVTGSGFYYDIGGRLYLNKAPQQATFPYCVYYVYADENNPDFTDDHEEFEIQFNIFSQNNSALEAGQLLDSLKDMFDHAQLSVSGWRHIEILRTSVLPNNDFEQVPPVQGYTILYDVLLEKQRS